MKKHKLITKPVPLDEVDLDNLVDDDQDYWDLKIARSEMRRWRDLKNQRS